MIREEKVSIVIPAYNAEKFIEDAVKSCFNQTYRPIEIIIVNDGSTDSTVNVVSNLSDLSPDHRLELRVIDIGENKGCGNALNVGISSAEGDYICLFAADDAFIDKRYVQKQVDCMNKTKALWSYFRDFYRGTTISNAKLIKTSYLPHLRILDPLFIKNSYLRLMMLMFRNPIIGTSVMIRKNCVEAYGNIDPVTRNVGGDVDLWMRYSTLNLELKTLKGAPVFYRDHPMQTTKRKNLMLYGSEPIRIRMLLTLEKTRILMKLIKNFTPYFLIILKDKVYLDRPFVSEFLFNYILDHRREFNRFFLKYIQKALNDVKRHINNRMLNRNKFLKDLALLMESNTFKKFERTFLG